MKLIVGLGNPGRKYKKNRHNIGFLALDHLAAEFSVDIRRRKFNAKYNTCSYNGTELVLVKPQTYMNLSGTALSGFISYFKLDNAQDILIIVDDIHLPFAALRMRARGSAGGHNGIRSVIDEIGSNVFARIRLGVGQPPRTDLLHAYVLSDFTETERTMMPQILDKARDAVLCWLDHGITETMQRYNSKSL